MPVVRPTSSTNRFADRRDLVNQAARLFGGEVLGREFVGDGDPATVNATQVTASGGFPEDKTVWWIRCHMLSLVFSNGKETM